MSFKNMVGNRVLSLIMSLLYFRWIHDSQSGMWIFYKESLKKMNLRSDEMAFSEEIKIEALCNPQIGFREIPINYSNRAGEEKLRPWRDGWNNLMFLFNKRIMGRRQRTADRRQESGDRRQKSVPRGQE